MIQITVETIQPKGTSCDLLDLFKKSVEKLTSAKDKVKLKTTVKSLIDKYQNVENKGIKRALLSEISKHLTLSDLKEYVDETISREE